MSTSAAVGLTSLKMGLAFTYPFFGWERFIMFSVIWCLFWLQIYHTNCVRCFFSHSWFITFLYILFTVQ
jgi:hypothetical protein